ncbi:MAG: Dam family site-specific DNA-(adenine-N6)-methyltransferase [Pseudomonadota bacterium]
MTPFLKWAGGKRWFIQRYSDLLPHKYNRYIEPFLGGGSVFFYLKPKDALLGDINPDLIAAYQGLQKEWSRLQSQLEDHQQKHSDAYYYSVRNESPADPIDRAARMIYLNRTCFNGIYRVNRQGKFNVPRGSKNTVVLENDNFEEAARLLGKAQIRLVDFEKLINEAGKNDLVFADPPYTVRHNFNGFIKYNEKLFSWGDQERLAHSLFKARKRGAKIVCTNANHASVRELYEDCGFHFIDVSRFSSISASIKSRKQFEELVIVSHLPKGEKKK